MINNLFSEQITLIMSYLMNGKNFLSFSKSLEILILVKMKFLLSMASIKICLKV